MFGLNTMTGGGANAILGALDRSLAIIEFDALGNVLKANDNFCKIIGYDFPEIKGKHHRMFVEPGYGQSQDYAAFWKKLGGGTFDSREYKRIAKGNREVWIQATYNPIKNATGKVVKVVKFATDITAEKTRNAIFKGKLDAIDRSQATIEFTPSGEIVSANANFLNAMGYELAEIKGRHHRIFVDQAYAESSEYREFWAKLNRGEHVLIDCPRRGKDGRVVNLVACYNPVIDTNGKIIGIIKIAVDNTQMAHREHAVNEIAKGLSSLAGNDLTYEITTPFVPEFEKLRSDFNKLVHALQLSMREIAGSTVAIQSGTSEISTAADDLSRRTEQQAASLEETAAALATITQTVKKSADGASHASDIVAVADRDAKSSALVVRKAVEAMDGIAESARKITQIIGVIDEIAFQTNLLALNAGVEAARAGDAGRGFAVVASEVRALAQRSAEAAKEIKGLISASTAQVEQGVKLVDETGKSLERIMTQVGEINVVVSEIAAGAKGQALGIEEVNTAITQMDQMTQQNAAMVEESTAASHHLTQEATRLAEFVGQFKTGLDHDARIRQAVQKAAPHAFRNPAPRAGKARAPRAVAAAADWDEF